MNTLQWNDQTPRQSSQNRLWQGVFGVLVVVTLGFFFTGTDLSSFFSNSDSVSATTKNGVQEVAMTVTGNGYIPSDLTIKAGVPVRWKVDGTDASGCTSIMTIPSLNISQPLKAGENVIEFTAPKKGSLAFMCSMGMVRGTFHVL